MCVWGGGGGGCVGRGYNNKHCLCLLSLYHRTLKPSTSDAHVDLRSSSIRSFPSLIDALIAPIILITFFAPPTLYSLFHVSLTVHNVGPGVWPVWKKAGPNFPDPPIYSTEFHSLKLVLGVPSEVTELFQSKSHSKPSTLNLSKLSFRRNKTWTSMTTYQYFLSSESKI